jgi:hypothetical protein
VSSRAACLFLARRTPAHQPTISPSQTATNQSNRTLQAPTYFRRLQPQRNLDQVELVQLSRLELRGVRPCQRAPAPQQLQEGKEGGEARDRGIELMLLPLPPPTWNRSVAAGLRQHAKRLRSSVTSPLEGSRPPL